MVAVLGLYNLFSANLFIYFIFLFIYFQISPNRHLFPSVPMWLGTPGGRGGRGVIRVRVVALTVRHPPLHYPPPTLPLPYPLPPTFKMGLEWVGISGQPGWGGMGVEWEGQASGELGGV